MEETDVVMWLCDEVTTPLYAVKMKSGEYHLDFGYMVHP